MDQGKKIQLDFLPPYSPQLNPIERVWKLTRKLCTHNRYYALLDDLVLTVEQQFKKWATSAPAIVAETAGPVENKDRRRALYD